MSYCDELDKIITDVTEVLGRPIHKNQYEIIDRGIPHKPGKLPSNKMGVYVFIFGDEYLKIGKVGPRSNARFQSQHYNAMSAKSTLAASLINDKRMSDWGITKENVGDWIKANTRRIDILFDKSVGIFTVELIEAALHYKYEPRYEGFTAQRNKKI
ncbi:hypothetical protein [Butyrivibrio fibrisolvens]|uniref:hypothetical protein n=1 Tax=Butyrivibrio fibrisolvens TaxID=831 RepID=UPI0003B6E499|nr:hypothetical protein [Butyrivibrio fibrisolvens]